MAKITFETDIRAQRVFHALVEAAKAGEPCPRNLVLAEIAESTGGAESASSFLSRLEKRYGKIRIERRGHVGRRVFIVGTDLVTDWSAPVKHRVGDLDRIPHIICEDGMRGVRFTDDPRSKRRERPWEGRPTGYVPSASTTALCAA